MRKFLTTILLVTLVVSIPASSSYAGIIPITTEEFISKCTEVSGLSLEQLLAEHYITQNEIDICNSKHVYASIVHKVLLPLMGLYPYPHELYEGAPTTNMGSDCYQDAYVALWSTGYDPSTWTYSVQQVDQIIEHLRTAHIDPPIQSQWDVNIDHTTYRSRNAMIRAYDNIRPEHIQWFNDNGWGWFFDVGGTSGHTWDDCAGVTNYLAKSIYIYSDTANTVYHEMGHAITTAANTRPLVDKLFELEGCNAPAAMSDYAQTSPTEYIACAYSQYYGNSTRLRKLCPYTYLVIKHGFFECEGPYNSVLLHYLQDLDCPDYLLKEASKWLAKFL